MIPSVIIAIALSASAQADQGTVAQAQASAEAVQQQGEPAKININGKLYEPNDIVCKKQRVSGSRIKKKLCVTAEQWVLLRFNAEEITREMTQGLNSINPGG